MLVVTRHRVPDGDADEFLEQAREALAALGAQVGYRGGQVGRAADDPTLWVVATTWDGVGAYRRALSAYDVRVRATPLLAGASNEPSAFEVLYVDAGSGGAPAGGRAAPARAGD